MRWQDAWQDTRVLAAVFVLLALVLGLDKYARGAREELGPAATHYNNFVIYGNSAAHLREGENLYQPWPHKQFDLFMYSPTFAACFWPLTMLPTVIGLCLWNIGGALVLLFAFRSLPVSSAASAAMAWLVVKDLMTTLQNSQANALTAGLIILAVAYWERERWWSAGSALAMSFYIKLFGAVAGILWLMYPHRKRSLTAIVGSLVVWGLLPLLVTTPALLAWQYQNFGTMLRAVHSESLGMSVMGILQAWCGLSGHKMWTVLIGGVLLMLPLARVRQHRAKEFRLGMLASVLLWVVLFNHKAESPTFVIAAAGMAIWFCSQAFSRVNAALVAVMILMTSFGASDLYPDWLQDQWIFPYHLRVLPPLAIWIKLQTELWTRQYASRDEVVTTSSPREVPPRLRAA
jgi:hypothetical protein